MYTHKIMAWRDSVGRGGALPIASPDEATARAMFAHVLRADSEFDHAELCERAHPTSDVFYAVETGHRAGTVAARMVPDTINEAMRPIVDDCYRRMMDANSTEPYVHAEYERWDEMLKASLVLLTNGDMLHARALRWAFTDSGADIAWYLKVDRNALCRDAGEMSDEDYEATLRWAVECEEGGDTWVDAFATREQAEEHAAALVANTTVVDRQATAG